LTQPQILMKTLNIFFLIFFSQLAFGQVSTHKNVDSRTIMISTYLSGKKCNYKAIKLINDQVQVDTCFNQKENKFTSNKTGLILSLELYSQLKNLSTSKWIQIQTELDNITRCDYAIPYELEIFENGKTLKFSLKRFMNCYPVSAKLIMEELDNYFSKLE